MNNLPVADILIFAIIAACIVISTMRGVIAEAGSMVAWVVSFFFAKFFAASFAEIAFASFQPRLFALALSFISLFILAYLIQKILRSLLTQAVSSVGLGYWPLPCWSCSLQKPTFPIRTNGGMPIPCRFSYRFPKQC